MGRRSLPIINIAPFLKDDRSPDGLANRKATAAALHSACVDYGFFYLDVSAFADPREPVELTHLARKFFELPQSEKEKLALKNQDGARGYQRLKENVTNGKADNHEGLDFYRPVDNPDKSKPIWGENQWPSDPDFKLKYEQWIEKMKVLGLIVMEAMAQGLGMTQDEWLSFRSKVDDSFWVMRVIGYPPLPNDHDGFSCGAHRDYGCLTFLYADSTPNALQVLSPQSKTSTTSANTAGLPDEAKSEGGVWIAADPIPGCLVVNIGEMWEIWTNGLYRATLHRVVHRSSNYRISIPFFYEPNFDCVVEPLAAALRLIEQGSPSSEKTYTPVVYGEFLKNKVGNNFADGKGRYDE